MKIAKNQNIYQIPIKLTLNSVPIPSSMSAKSFACLFKSEMCMPDHYKRGYNHFKPLSPLLKITTGESTEKITIFLEFRFFSSKPKTI